MNATVARVLVAVLFSAPLLSAAPPAGATPEDLAYLRGIMRETWHYIDFFVSPSTGLPYDSNEARDITNTTNVGLYLAALSMARRLGYIGEAEALARARKILDSLDRYEHWHRLYGNWLDPEGKVWKAKPGESNISDYNKLPAGLILVRQTFPALRERCTAFLDEIPWEKFHEPETDRICYAFDVAGKRVFSPVYFHRGEDKILGHFLAIASGKVPASSWDRHDRQEEERHGYRYFQYGWQGGGLFMQFICGLFLDDRGTPLGRSSATFAWAQQVHAQRIGAPVWGWSACVAPSGQYLGMGALVDPIVTPHASALAVHLFPREVIDNLKRLESFGLREPFVVDGRPQRFGFRDAVNWATGEVTDKYLVLDQAMLFLSLVNFCEDGLVWKTFGADPMVARGKQLIADYRDAPAKRAEEAAYIASLGDDAPGVFWLVDGAQAVCRPGLPLRRSLYARSLSRQPVTDGRANWQVKAPGGRVLHAGRHVADLAPRETRRLATLELPTDEAGYGDAWMLEADFRRGDQVTHTRSETLVFYSYQDLAGTWRAARGDVPGWAAPQFNDRAWSPIKIPSKWEDGVFPDYDGTAWLRLSFRVDAASAARWGDRPLAIALGAVDDADETYLNGMVIGRTGAFPPAKETAYNTPRVYPIERTWLRDRNLLAVRVSDWGGNGGLWRGPVALGPLDELRQALEP